MHKNREDLFKLFQSNTGKSVHVPKGESSIRNLQSWQPSRVDVYQL
jgi:hypothetical protein